MAGPRRPREHRAKMLIQNTSQVLAAIHQCPNGPCKGCTTRADMLYDLLANKAELDPAS